MKQRWPLYVLIWTALAILFVRLWRDGGYEPATMPEQPGVATDDGRHPARRVPSVTRPVGDRDVTESTRTPIRPAEAPPERGLSEAVHDGPYRLTNDYVVRLRDADEARRFAVLAEASGATVSGGIPALHSLRIRVTGGGQWRRLLAAWPGDLEHAPNHIVWYPERRLPPEPPEGIVYRPFGADAPLWLGLDDTALPGGPVTVALLDDGVTAHWTLDGVPVRVVDLVGGDTDGTGWHGSAMAALIAGRSGDAPGVAAGAEILSYRVLRPDGAGDAFTLAEAIIAAVDAGASVINCSLGTYGDNLALRAAVDYAHARGVPIVASVGNDARDGVLMYPAGYASVIAVAAVDADGRHAWFSNRGAGVDLAAPGYGIVAAGRDEALALVSGTSPSAALVSGAVARLLSLTPTLTPDAIREILHAASDDFGAPGADPELGVGILNIERMERRDRSGLFEMSARPPHVVVDPAAPDRFTGVFFAQNSGTEPVPRVDVTVTLDGQAHRETFHDVPVGGNVVMLRDLGRREGSPRELAATIEAVILGAPGLAPAGRLGATIRLE